MIGGINIEWLLKQLLHKPAGCPTCFCQWQVLQRISGVTFSYFAHCFNLRFHTWSATERIQSSWCNG